MKCPVCRNRLKSFNWWLMWTCHNCRRKYIEGYNPSKRRHGYVHPYMQMVIVKDRLSLFPERLREMNALMSEKYLRGVK